MEPESKIFGQRVRERRIELGYTEQQLAKKLKCSDSTVQYYERGELKKPRKVLRDVAAALQVTEDWLLGRTDGRAPPPRELTPGEIADHYAALPQAERQEWSRRAMEWRKNE